MPKGLRIRKSRGASITEFGATIAVLVCLIFIPVLSLAFVPLRYAMAQGVVIDFASRLAHSEKRSDAYSTLDHDIRWIKYLASCGIRVDEVELTLVVSTANGASRKIVLQEGTPVPDEWLPGGKLSPCAYSLNLDCTCAVSPLFGSTGTVTGINAPVTLNVSSSAHWENLSRDPRSSTLAFFINE